MELTTTLKSVFKYGLVILAALFLGWQTKSCSTKPVTQLVRDSVLVPVYLESLEKDTSALRWYEKIIKEKVPAEKIFVQKLDTVTREKIKEVIKNFDVMLKLKKDGFNYTVTAFNEAAGYFKEEHFKIYGDKVELTPAVNRIEVTGSKYDWKGINLFYQAGLRTDSLLNARGFKNMQHTIGIETELAYKNKLTLGLSEEYSITDNNLFTKAKLKYFPFR